MVYKKVTLNYKGPPGQGLHARACILKREGCDDPRDGVGGVERYLHI